MLRDQQRVVDAAMRASRSIERAIAIVAEAWRRGGRVIFVGAGTSGRLGVLEAAEMPPTFGVSPRLAVAVMAGGRQAVHRAREGVEDDAAAGARAIERLRAGRADAVVGISASGVTPFVCGALRRARRRHAHLIGITCGERAALQRLTDVLVPLRVGPEAIAGSTRLKAGTATKIVLNVITTAAMVELGKTYGNLMVDLQVNSAKLEDRAIRIVCRLTGLDPRGARRVLRQAHGSAKLAIVMQKSGLESAAARRRLRAAGGSVRRAIETPGAADRRRPPDRRGPARSDAAGEMKRGRLSRWRR